MISELKKKTMIKSSIKIINKNGINFILKTNNKIQKNKPWIGNLFSNLYDMIMHKFLFPHKLNADIKKHYQIMIKELAVYKNKMILDIACGSGDSVNFINNTNHYYGIDISKNLIKKAIKKFNYNNFVNPMLYLASADNLPFNDSIFDLCLCILAFNFFENQRLVINEIMRVLKSGGLLLCCVPIPEKNIKKSKIRGRLYSQYNLKKIFSSFGLRLDPIFENNGSLFYFKIINP